MPTNINDTNINDVNISNNIVHSRLGYMRPIATAQGLMRLDWQQEPFSDAVPMSGEAASISFDACTQLAAYLKGERREFDLPLDLSGVSPAMKEWFSALNEIPYGTLRSYSGLAEIKGNRKAARSAGQACRLNPLPVIIPCHRVNSAKGGVNQYSGGSETTPQDPDNLARKKWLQDMEMGAPA